MDAGTSGPDAHRTVHGACARTRRGARVVDFSDGVNEAVVVDAPLAPVVPELVVHVAFGGVLRRPAAQQQRQQRDEREGDAAERALQVRHGDRH